MAAKKKKAKKSSNPPALRAPSTKGAAQAAPTPIRQPRTTSASGRKAGAPDLTPQQRQSAVKALAKKVNENFKSQVLVTASEANSNSFLRRPCGIMQLDVDCAGGLAAASFNTISGPDNSGKSTLLYHYFAMHQRLYGDDAYCALVCSEATVDYPQARRVGWIIPYPEQVIAGMQEARARDNLPPLTAEELADLRREVGHNEIVTNLTTAEEMLDVTEKLLESNLYGIIGLDSYEGLMPNAEAALETLEDFPQQAARASAITRFLQHYGPISRNKDHYTTFIMTCQVRVNRKKNEASSFMQKFIQDWAEVVPPSVKHWRQIGLLVWSGAKINEKSTKTGADGKEKEGKVALGKEVNWTLPKGKNGTHDNITGATSYYYDARGFEPLRTVVLTGIKYGVIREKGGELNFFKNGEPHNYLIDVPGIDAMVGALRDDIEAELEVRYAILNAANKPCLYV